MIPARTIVRLFIPVLALLAAAATSPAQNQDGPRVWVTAWGASQQIPEPENALPEEVLRYATVRQIFHVSLGGSVLRVHVSNAFGTEPLHFTSVHIAKPAASDSSAIVAGTDTALSFAGQVDVIVPASAEFVSDAVTYPLSALSDVAVTFHLEDPPSRETGHPGSRATSYYVHGNLVSAATLPGASAIDHWYQISEIDVQANAGAAAVVALGDSITDGHGASTNGNDRWTDVLAVRLQQLPATRNVGVSNQGDWRQSSAHGWPGPECAGSFRSRCAGTGGSPMVNRV